MTDVTPATQKPPIGLADDDSVIGLCLATCAMDLVLGRRSLEDVAFFFTNTRITKKAEWEPVIEKLEERAPAANRRDVRRVIQTLLDHAQMFQPRIHGMLPAQFLKGKHWIKVTDAQSDPFLARLLTAAREAQSRAATV